MRPRLLTLTYDARDPDRLARFWAGMLGREVVEDAGGLLLPGDDTTPGLRFVPSQAEMVRPNLIHLHLTSTTLDDQQQTVAKVLGLGGSHLDVGQLPEEGHVVLADPEGYEFDVIEPGNNFLAGTGFLGELACDGTREVGLFWSAALGWPLVWDQDEETAIQSPSGGTKVAWGGPPLEQRKAPTRQRFEVAAAEGDLEAEVDRLVALGATRLGAAMLADPDGNEFSVRAI
jgi:catechol 2,3-dioxygenase-like lactoylglutathione lyase family enzyme